MTSVNKLNQPEESNELNLATNLLQAGHICSTYVTTETKQTAKQRQTTSCCSEIETYLLSIF